MNSLKIIQTISKIGGIISKIIYICSIVGLCICAVGLILLPYGDDVLKIGGVTLKSLFSDVEDLKALCPAVGYLQLIALAILSSLVRHKDILALKLRKAHPLPLMELTY